MCSVFAVLATLLAVTCHAYDAAADSCPEKPYPEFQKYAGNLGAFKIHLLNYKCFGGYERDVETIAAKAEAYISRRAPRVSKPAIVLDIDETALSNWRKIDASDFRFNPQCECGSAEQSSDDQGDLIAPTLELFNTAKAKGIAVFFITSRVDDKAEREATEANLRKVGYSGWTELIMRSANSEAPSIASYKAAQRASIEARSFRIIANVGDQESDLAGGHAERGFKLPNPFYYIP